MTDANYNGARQPVHDTAGLARLIYCMRTNEDGRALERNWNAETLRDNLLRTGHPTLANLVFRSLIFFNRYFPPEEIAAMAENDRPIKDGKGLYKAIEDAISALRRPRLVLRKPEQHPPRQAPEGPLVLRHSDAPAAEPRRLHLTRQPQPQRPRIVIRRPGENRE